jgi:O-antigen ligase
MKKISLHSTLLVLLLSVPQLGFAYLGPGSGVSAIGALIALLALILIAIVGFVYFPIKRMLEKKNAAQSDFEDIEEESE